MVKMPGYFVHQWDVRLRDFMPTNYVGDPSYGFLEFII